MAASLSLGQKGVLMRFRLTMLWGFPWLIGCVASHPSISSAPIPSEIGWSAPQVMHEEPIPVAAAARPPTAVEQVGLYAEGTVYKVKVPLKAPVMVMLEPGEEVNKVIHDRMVILPGEGSSPWTIVESESHTPRRAHVSLQCTQAGLSQGMTILTTRRVYLLDLQSVATSKIRIVRWTYDTPVVQAKAKPRLLPDPQQPQTFYGGYTWGQAQGPLPSWAPRQVLNDQRGKTYIVFPTYLTAASTPLLRLITGNGPEVVHYRVDPSGTVFILESVFDVAELRLGHGPTTEVVRITRGVPIAIGCPGAAECPQWPAQVATVR
jgi:type IV secretion system protein VirB9